LLPAFRSTTRKQPLPALHSGLNAPGLDSSSTLCRPFARSVPLSTADSSRTSQTESMTGTRFEQLQQSAWQVGWLATPYWGKNLSDPSLKIDVLEHTNLTNGHPFRPPDLPSLPVGLSLSRSTLGSSFRVRSVRSGLQPKLFPMPDYCYYDRLLTGIEILYCSLWLSGFACYSRTFRLSSLPTSRDSWTKRLSGSGLISRRMRFSLRRPLTEVSRHLSPLTQSLKERFRLH
jgi:hypothetical protein